MSIHQIDNPPASDAVARPDLRGRVQGRPTPRRIRPGWILLAVGAVAVVALGAVLMRGGGGAPPPAAAVPVAEGMTVTAATVERVDMTRTLMVTGSLAAWDELPIGTSTSGLAIVEVLVDEGDRVEAGQLLARFDDSVLRADLLQKEAALKEAEAIAAEAQANVRRAEELGRTGTVSQRELESRRAAAATAQARVGVAQANREQSLARLRQTEVRAPAAGTVARRNARLGAVMSAGGSELFRIVRNDRVELVAEVPERDLAGIAPGQTVSLGVDGGVGPAHRGTVRLVSPTVDPKTRMGLVRIDVPTAPDLRPGMFMVGRVDIGRVSGLAVPESAVVYKDAKPLLFVVGEGAKVQMRTVETGIRGDGRVTILKGVAAGEAVVVAGAGYLKDGDHVKISERPPEIAVKPLPVHK